MSNYNISLPYCGNSSSCSWLGEKFDMELQKRILHRHHQHCKYITVCDCIILARLTVRPWSMMWTRKAVTINASRITRRDAINTASLSRSVIYLLCAVFCTHTHAAPTAHEAAATPPICTHTAKSIWHRLLRQHTYTIHPCFTHAQTAIF